MKNVTVMMEEGRKPVVVFKGEWNRYDLQLAQKAMLGQMRKDMTRTVLNSKKEQPTANAEV